MRRLTFPWLLGARLALARAGILRTALAAIGVAIASFVLLCAIVAPHVAHARSQRDQARTAICAADASRPEHACGMAGVHVTDNWRSDAIRKQLVADGARMPAPPGVSRLPNPGEIVASPALARLLNDPKDSTLRDRYPGRIIGTIGPAGLLEPHELLAYVGSDSAPQPGAQTRIIGYDPAKHHVTVGEGAQPGQSADALSQRQKIITIIATVLALLAPVILFLTSCARLSASSRDRRLAALRIVGLTPPQLQVITAVETGVGAMAGAILGVISLQLARPALAQISPSGYGWFASDLQPSIAQVLAVVLGVPAVALVVGAASTTQLTRKLFSASYTPTRRLSPLRLLPALAGIGLTAWAASRTLPADDSQNTAMTIIMTAGIVFLLVGLALVTPLVAQLVARGVANSSRSLAALLGARRLQFDPATSARVISGLVLLVFCAGFAQTVLATVKSHTHGAAAKSFASGVVEVSAPNARSSDAVAEKILAIPGVRRWIPVAHQSVTVTDAASTTEAPSVISISTGASAGTPVAPGNGKALVTAVRVAAVAAR